MVFSLAKRIMYSYSTRSHLQFARPGGVYAFGALIVFCLVYFFYHQRGRYRLSVTTKTGKGESFRDESPWNGPI